MADKEMLSSMLDDLVHDKPEQAKLDFHVYLQTMMKDILGIQQSEQDFENKNSKE